MALVDLEPAPYNPRKISDKAMKGLQASLRRFGLVQPIIWNKRTKRIVGGHQRAHALAGMGKKDADVLVVDLPETEEKALNLTLNNPHISGEFTEGLGPILENIKLEIPAIEFAELGLDALWKDVPKGAVEVEEDEAPEPPKNPVTKAGDLWTLGGHRLVCADSTRAEAYSLMNPEGISTIFTDPPYGIGMAPASVARDLPKLANDDLPEEEFSQFLRDALGLAAAYGEEFFVCCDWRRFHVFRGVMAAIGRPVKNLIVWNKQTRAQNLNRFAFVHEFIAYHGEMGPPTLDVNVWTVGREYSTEHLTPKPVELVARALRHGSGGVLDPFGGSGSTFSAAEQLNRRCYGIELEPRYCDVIVAMADPHGPEGEA
jgi:DNA modification methylase